LRIGPYARFMCRPFRGRLPTFAEWRAPPPPPVGPHPARGLDPVGIHAPSALVPAGAGDDAPTTLRMLPPPGEPAELGVAVFVLHPPSKGRLIEGQAARGSGALGACADINLEMDTLSGPTSDDRRRRIAGFSRFAETTRRLVIELSADGADYAALGD